MANDTPETTNVPSASHFSIFIIMDISEYRFLSGVYVDTCDTPNLIWFKPVRLYVQDY